MNEPFLYIFQKGFNYSQDGAGNRLVYHLCRCNLKCPWCSNPEGMARGGEAQKIRVDAVLNEAVSCRMMFIDGGGVTLTGGEVSCQYESAAKLLSLLKEQSINTCIETNASLKETLAVAELADYVIADFKSPDGEKLKEVTGADIGIIKSNLLEIAKSGKPLLVRVPLIKGFNTGAENAKGFALFFKELLQSADGNVKFEMLQYHEFGKEKWAKLGLEYTVTDGFVNDDDIKIFTDELNSCDIKLIKT